MTDEKKRLITVDTDWRLDESGGRRYGICTITVPEPFSHLTFRRGFPLTDPTHGRCATFAMLMGLEVVACTPDLRKTHVSAVIVKSKQVYDLVAGVHGGKTRAWSADTDARSKPLKIMGFTRAFFANMFRLLDHIRLDDSGELVLSEAEPGEERNMLMSHSVNLDVDPESSYGQDAGDEAEGQRRLDDLRARNKLKQELYTMQGTRPSRAQKRLTKKGLQKAAKGPAAATNKAPEVVKEAATAQAQAQDKKEEKDKIREGLKKHFDKLRKDGKWSATTTTAPPVDCGNADAVAAFLTSIVATGGPGVPQTEVDSGGAQVAQLGVGQGEQQLEVRVGDGEAEHGAAATRGPVGDAEQAGAGDR